ncbi:hypothetical protein B0O99DRAFT_477262, partial [Bisporella sp. PMI_857]
YQKMNKLYSLPAPMRTYPLPTFIPHNPISLFHVLYTWLSQVITRPSSAPSPLYQAWWSPETRSIHVTDSRSIRGLWEQGFYGKGNLSRSEPSWMEREQQQGKDKTKRHIAEEHTQRVREKRQQTKWERARKEREAIEQIRLEEASSKHENTLVPEEELPDLLMDSDTSLTASESDDIFMEKTKTSVPSPVGPMELLSLPNSTLDLNMSAQSNTMPIVQDDFQRGPGQWVHAAPVGPKELLALPNAHFFRPTSIPLETLEEAKAEPIADKSETAYIPTREIIAQAEATTGITSLDALSHNVENTAPVTPKIKRQKSVRFSPTVEKTTFDAFEPPSPERALSPITTLEIQEEPLPAVNQEHYQLTPQEAFFLTYALGVLTVFDPATKIAIPNEELLNLFRRNSSFPPVANPSLSPDDTFMTQYVVYHHFRSLGWCVRGGAKFSCDFMLYQRGPPFSHAEFAVLILPAYSDKYWSKDVFLQNYVQQKQTRTWSWLHCLNRVINMAKKTLVLVYVDIPRPLSPAAEQKLGMDGILSRYKVREFILKRWARDRER